VSDAGNTYDTGASHSEAATAQCCEVAVYLPGGAESAYYNILPACTLLVVYYGIPARYDSRSNPAQFRLFKLKRGRTDGCAADHDINAIRADSERARAQIVDVLATIDPEA
jgi:hypothetical protein